MRKILGVIISVVIFFACYVIANNTMETDRNSYNGKVNMEFWTISEYYGEEMQLFVDAYNDKTKGKKIDLNINIYSRNQIANKLNVAFESGSNVPDIVDIHFQDLAQFVGESNYLKLYPLNSITDGYLLNQAALQPFISNNVLYGIPYSTGKMALFYNLNILAKYYVDASKIETWQDYIHMGEYIKQQGGPELLPVDIRNNDFFLALMLQKNPQITECTYSKVVQADEYHYVFDIVAEMVNKYEIASIPIEYDIYNTRFFEDFKKGSYVSIIAPMEYTNELIRNIPEFKSNIIAYPLPKMENSNIINVSVPQYATAITSKCKDIETAKAFLEFSKLTDEALFQKTDRLMIQNISGEEGISSHIPQNRIYDEYFRGNPVKLVNSNEIVPHFTGNSQIKEVIEVFIKDLLYLIDNENTN